MCVSAPWSPPPAPDGHSSVAVVDEWRLLSADAPRRWVFQFPRWCELCFVSGVVKMRCVSVCVQTIVDGGGAC